MDVSDNPLAIMSEGIAVNPGDRLILVLRSIAWSESNVADITTVLDRLGLNGRYAILYLDENDEAHVIRMGP